ncbi:tRNA pseudouridine synthase A [Nitratidesulfovibrio liaohensis]|uniref:tRNA pseudouridine synthase A n=1 Tax=Nitratidesulfovibrio liaohensis TaxID=2604158 RepID=A0ABY9R892_9BACT|nr:tRNA pseudouridine synthase A [Nitratidesulfovibrio liaohensis]WMW67033.1 tRNA pseudouridine synthase A [Nitratidesulfovibrio liaohensis]
MARLALTVSYVGTRLAGWQIQARTDRPQPCTVQGELERIAERIVGAPVRLHGAGRTDSGVHAEAQVAHMDVPDHRANLDWQRAFNAGLPDDIAVAAVVRVPDGFHARFDARGKTYTYRLWPERRWTPPRLAPFAWATGPLDLEAMDAAAAHLHGMHDFASFQNTGTDIVTTIRTVTGVARRHEGEAPVQPALPGAQPLAGSDEAVNAMAGDLRVIAWDFEADGFLKQMVRNMMGLLVAVGRGKLHPDAVPAILAARDRKVAPATAPAHGLTLTKVHY